jgi:hypothetical protein
MHSAKSFSSPPGVGALFYTFKTFSLFLLTLSLQTDHFHIICAFDKREKKKDTLSLSLTLLLSYTKN